MGGFHIVTSHSESFVDLSLLLVNQQRYFAETWWFSAASLLSTENFQQEQKQDSDCYDCYDSEHLSQQKAKIKSIGDH